MFNYLKKLKNTITDQKHRSKSVGIKWSHVWSHDQGDRPNHVTNLPSGETG
jgi:hypothetical protein